MILLRERTTRRGQSLILVVFMIFLFAGIMALTLDFGFVLLSRRQMQTSVNAAALVGARQHNTARADARQILRLNFDDDLDLSSNNTTIGVGIASNLTQDDGYRATTLGDGTSGTSGILANRSGFIYRPNDFALNSANADHGDMVIGDYDDASDDHSESASYVRGDFMASSSGNAFLVRMRRTHNPNDLDNVTGVSSNGGGIPLLAGRLALFSATQPGDGYSIRRDGTTVRATAIAHEQPVVAVFVSTSAVIYPVLEYTVQVGATETWRDATIEELLARDPADPSQPLRPERIAIGKVVDMTGTAVAVPSPRNGYVSVVDPTGRIIGFRLEPTDLSRRRSDSPRLQDAWAELGAMSSANREVLMSLNRTTERLLKTPASVRTIR